MKDERVKQIRRFKRFALGIAQEGATWFVYMRMFGGSRTWAKHTGPYSTSEQAEDWIKAIREE